jgi:hypothetical protein
MIDTLEVLLVGRGKGVRLFIHGEMDFCYVAPFLMARPEQIGMAQ